jgi:membrane protein
VAVLLQISEYLNLLTWPWLRDKLRAEVPPFVQSISIVFWAFIATLIILAGAEWAARVKVESLHEEQPDTYSP